MQMVSIRTISVFHVVLSTSSLLVCATDLFLLVISSYIYEWTILNSLCLYWCYLRVLFVLQFIVSLSVQSRSSVCVTIHFVSIGAISDNHFRSYWWQLSLLCMPYTNTLLLLTSFHICEWFLVSIVIPFAISSDVGLCRWFFLLFLLVVSSHSYEWTILNSLCLYRCNLVFRQGNHFVSSGDSYLCFVCPTKIPSLCWNHFIFVNGF